jgi:hypothetical protein
MSTGTTTGFAGVTGGLSCPANPSIIINNAIIQLILFFFLSMAQGPTGKFQ